MPLFVYRARNYDGELLKGRADAADRSALEKELEGSGLIPISISEARTTFDIGRIKAQFKHIGTEDLIVLTRQMGTMYRAGILMARILLAVGEQSENSLIREIMATVKEDVERGATLADALSRHPEVFDELYVGMVGAGEAGGVLDEIFERLSILLEKEVAIKAKVRSATLYPKIVVTAIVVAVFVLVTFVVPKFAALYGRFGAELPLPTRMLVATSLFFTKYWYLMILLIAASLLSFRFFIKTGTGRRWWDNLRISFPLFGPLSLKASVSRFSRILGTLHGSGFPILSAIETSRNALGNVVVSEEVERIRDEVRRGKPIAEPLGESRFFPPMMTQMVAVGEETGKLEEMLVEVADHLDEEVDYIIRNLSTLLEPVLLSIIFGMVLFLALALFLPMWDMVKLAR